MNALVAEFNAALRIKRAGQDIAAEGETLTFIVKRAPNAQDEIAYRIALIRKSIFAAEKAAKEFADAIGAQPTEEQSHA